MWEAINGGLHPQHDIMASFPLVRHPELLKTNHLGFSGVTV